MIPKGKGENKEYCNKVIRGILEYWDERVSKNAVNKTKRRNRECE